MYIGSKDVAIRVFDELDQSDLLRKCGEHVIGKLEKGVRTGGLLQEYWKTDHIPAFHPAVTSLVIAPDSDDSEDDELEF